jgi:hypothetical protein
VNVSHFLFNNTYGLPVRTTDTKCPNQVIHVWLFDLQTICAKDGLETWFSPNDDIRNYLLDMKHGSTKNAFRDWITRNDLNGVSFFYLSCLITLTAYVSSQGIPTVQILYFMFDWSIYRLFVLNTNRKRESLQMIIFVIICSTWSMVQVKTRFETSITRKDVNGVSFFHLSNIITLMA